MRTTPGRTGRPRGRLQGWGRPGRPAGPRPGHRRVPPGRRRPLPGAGRAREGGRRGKPRPRGSYLSGRPWLWAGGTTSPSSGSARRRRGFRVCSLWGSGVLLRSLSSTRSRALLSFSCELFCTAWGCVLRGAASLPETFELKHFAPVSQGHSQAVSSSPVLLVCK